MTVPWSNPATNLIVITSGAPNTGLFIYNGTPAAGNPPVLWAVAPGVTSDPFGNTVSAVLGAGTPGGPSTQIDQLGDVTLTGSGGSVLSLTPAANLPFSFTSSLAGIMQSVAALGSGDSNQQQAGLVSGIKLGTGNTAKKGKLFTSPYGSTSGMGLLLEATNDGGTDTPFGTFGTVTTVTGTLTFTPVFAVLPGAVLLYSTTGGVTVVTKQSGSGTIPIPATVSVGYGEVWAGTSAGGGTNGSTSFGAAGGSGSEYAAEPALALTPGGTASYSVGAGGIGSSSGTGGTGANSTLTGSAVTVTARAPAAGIPINSTVSNSPGTGSTNTIHFDGGQGGHGIGTSNHTSGAGGGSSAGTSAAGNPGANSPSGNGAGGAGGTAPAGGAAGGKGGTGTSGGPTAGSAGSAPGAGGGGAGAGASARAGGNGAAGQVRLTYVSPPTIIFSVASAAGTDQFGTAFPANAYFNQPIAPQQPGAANATAEVWHSLGTLTGFSVTEGRYRLVTENEVEIDIDVTGSGTHAASVAWSTTLAAAYRPAVNHTQPLSTNRNVVAGDGNQRFTLDTTGVVTVLFPVANTTNAYRGCARVPLN